MKKILSVILVALMLFSVSASAATLEIDGKKIKSNMLFEDSTAYIPLSSVAKAINAPFDTDENTQSVFINGINLFAKKTETVNVYLDGKKYTPESNSDEIKNENGTVYMPAHLVAQMLEKEASWDKETATLSLSTPVLPVAKTVIDENTTYVIVNRGTGKVLSSTGNALVTEDFAKTDSQKFKLVKTEFDGYYHIKAVSTGFNLDVNAHGTTPGVNIITWEQGTGDNQKFLIEDVAGGTLISARSCHLPIEPYMGKVIQNTRDDSSKNQKWSIVPFDSYTTLPVKKAEKLIVDYDPEKDTATDFEEDALYRTFSIDSMFLTGSDGLKMGNDAEKWELVAVGESVYLMTNLISKKSVDVSGRSYDEGGAVITYNTSSQTNQRWILEENDDGTFYIKSVHSSLYLTIKDDGTLMQAAKNDSYKQRWTMAKVN